MHHINSEVEIRNRAKFTLPPMDLKPVNFPHPLLAAFKVACLFSMAAAPCLSLRPAVAIPPCHYPPTPYCFGPPLPPVESRPNLVINGTFDTIEQTGEPTGWTVVNDDSPFGGNTVSPGQGNPEPSWQNNSFFYIGGTSQSISTMPNREYDVFFDLLNLYPESGYNGAFQISFGNQYLLNLPFVPFTGSAWQGLWKTYVFHGVKASGSSTLLSLLGRNAYYSYDFTSISGNNRWGQFFIDNIKVYQSVPAPLPALGVAAAFQASRRIRKRMRQRLGGSSA